MGGGLAAGRLARAAALALSLLTLAAVVVYLALPRPRPDVQEPQEVQDLDCDRDLKSVAPQGVHLAFAGRPSESIAISFFTCADGGTPWALLQGGSRGDLVTRGTTSRYFKRFHHDVVVEGLEPDTEYSYSVELVKGERSQVFRFRTLLDDNRAEPIFFSALFVGSMGVNNSGETLTQLQVRTTTAGHRWRQQAAFTMHLGDIGYADDFAAPQASLPSSGRSYEAVYDWFQNSLEPVAAYSAYMVLPGDHDESCSSSAPSECPEEQRNFTAFRHRFRMPSMECNASSAPHHNLWYSWRVGAVHFVALATEGGLLDGDRGFGDQLAWLRQDLAAARRQPKVTWIVAMGHRPWYSSRSTYDPDEELRDRQTREALEPLFAEFGVDVWLSGHRHFYERTDPVFAGRVDFQLGLVHIMNGAAGSNEGMELGRGPGHDLIRVSFYDGPGYGELAVDSESIMTWRYFRSSDGTLVDEALIAARWLPGDGGPHGNVM